MGKDIYLALAAVGWADGQLTTPAADAIVRTALDEGLEFEEVAEIEAATKSPINVGQIDHMEMTKADRLYVYAVASWIAELDGKATDAERVALARLGNELRIPDAPRQRADEIMQEIAAHADRPERFDLLSLRRTLDARLEEARQARLQGMLDEAADESS
ncbi:MAG: hypothetical protein DRI90_15635 [Deltaproteobacteria bacterium]|nr:MAG: hypothetical protein DRI90_15635 [Deltaproteobacteria bacterium]